MKHRVALRLLAANLAEDESFRERFLRESELAASLDHPNILPVYEAGEAEGQLYVAMRYLEGSDLASLLAREERLSLSVRFWSSLSWLRRWMRRDGAGAWCKEA